MLLREVAAKLDVDSSLLSRAENGKKLPSREQIISMAKVYNEDANRMLALYLSELVVAVLDVDKDLAIEALVLAEQQIRNGVRSNSDQH